MKKVICVIAASALLTFPSFAADPVEEVAVASAYDWSGFYAGVHAGGGWSNVDWVYQGLGNTADHDGDGVLGGIQLGYNVQSGGFVYGVEADITATGITGSTSCPNPAYDCISGVNWLGTGRVRAGTTVNNLLFYGTAGLAFGGVDIKTIHLTDPTIGTNGTSQTRLGWAAGAGIEWGLSPNLSTKFEYMYQNLGDDTYEVDFGLPVDAEVQIHMLRVGLNYQF
jgi:outer membrane immunogenic protein